MRGLVWSLVVLLLLGVVGFGGWRLYDAVTTSLVRERCHVVLDNGNDTLELTAEQARNASVIVAVSFQRDLPEQAAVIALATAWQESGLRNIDYGDRDSLGLFQQRPSYGWGSEEEILDPWYSSARFYEELVKFPGWESGDVNDVAQQVQRSGHPEAYRKHEGNARALAGALRGSRPATFSCVDRGERTGGTDVVAEVVSQVPGVSAEATSTQLVLTSDDETALWAATQLALAHTRDAGITSARLAGHEWRERGAQGWEEVATDVPAGTAVVDFREAG